MKGFIQFLYRAAFSDNKDFLFRLVKVLRFYPSNLSLYEVACIHKSATVVNDEGHPVNNERLEYLGDAILGLIVAEYLFKKYPESNEGFLTKMRSKIVNGDRLSMLAGKLNLSSLLINRVQNENANKHILGDALEALIGAIYLDQGYRQTKKYILKRMIGAHIDLEKLESLETNYKSLLIEWSQKFKKEVTFYTDVEPYDPTRFISCISIGDTLLGSGIGVSKKEAEQLAAMETLKELHLTDGG